MRFIKLIKRPLFFVLFIIVLGTAAAIYFYFFRKTAPVYDFALVKRGDVVQGVSVAGKVKPVEEVELAFEKSGKVAGVYAKVGDAVESGQSLVILDSNDLFADLAQAEAAHESSKAQYKQYQAALAAQEAKLAELKIGTRLEEIQVQEAKVESARISLSEARKNLMDKIQDAYTKSDDAVRNKVDQFFSNPRGASPNVNFVIGDSQLKVNIESGRVTVEKILVDWSVAIIDLTIASDLDFYADLADNNLDAIKSFLGKAAFAVNGLVANSTLSQTTIDTWRADVSTARTNVNTAVTNLSTAAEEFKSAETDLVIVENELVLEKAGSTVEQIASQEASVEQARANLSSQFSQIKQAEAKIQAVQAQIAKNTIKSPLGGVVTKQDAKVGEIVTAGKTVVAVISAADFEIEVNIPEADFAKVKIGDGAKLTLDAYGEDVVWTTRVVKIDPAETMIGGVPTYKVILQFEGENGRVKSGMTANVDIMTAKRENVIIVPQRAVITKNNERFVRVIEGETVLEKKVETGLRGSDGNIEIVNGLNEGEKIVTFVKNGSN